MQEYNSRYWAVQKQRWESRTISHLKITLSGKQRWRWLRLIWAIIAECLLLGNLQCLGIYFLPFLETTKLRSRFWFLEGIIFQCLCLAATRKVVRQKTPGSSFSHGFSFTAKNNTLMDPSTYRHSLSNIDCHKEITFQHECTPWDIHSHHVSELTIFIVNLKYYEEKKYSKLCFMITG